MVSGELGFGDKKAVAEDAETHYCADFFVNEEPKPVNEYIWLASQPDVSASGLRRQKMERYALPGERNANIALVFDSTHPDVQELLANSATASTLQGSSLDGFPIRFPRNNPGETTRHRAVLVGLPANLCTEIIVGGRISQNEELLRGVQQSIHESGLHITILDTQGNIL